MSSDADGVGWSQQGGAQHCVFKFSNIARPRIILQLYAGFRTDVAGVRTHLANRFADKVIGQFRDILAAFAQGRQINRNHAQTKVQVFAELLGGDRIFEILVGRGDYARLHPERFEAADARELAFLQHAQQLGLQLDRQIADFVEEERAAAGLLDLARAPLGRAGEGPALVAEEFAFEQSVRDGRAVHGDERRRASAAT